MPRWLDHVVSLAVVLGRWEFFGRDINPVFGSYPSAIARGILGARRIRQARDGAVREPPAVRRRLALAIVVGVPLGLVIGRFRDARGGDRHLRHGWLCHAARGAGAAAHAVARPGLCGEGRGGVPDVGLSDLHQHLARRHRGAKEPDRGRQVLRRARTPSSCAASSCRRRCPISWRASGSRSAARSSAW